MHAEPPNLNSYVIKLVLDLVPFGKRKNSTTYIPNLNAPSHAKPF
jgi:hypothetical protein